MGYIYRINNTINNKNYIGKTTTCIQERFSKHIYESNNKNCKGYNFILHKAFRKYGTDNFKLELLEEVPNEELSTREQFWIKHYNTLMPNGYNMTFGGEGSIKIDYSQVYQEWDNEVSVPNIAKKLNCSITQIKNILKNKDNYSSEENLTRVINSTKKKVGQYNQQGELLYIYDSIKEAAEAVNVDRSCISRCCSGKKKNSRGYKWSFITEMADALATGKIKGTKEINNG